MADPKKDLLFFVREIIERLEDATRTRRDFPTVEIVDLVERAEELRKAAGYEVAVDDNGQQCAFRFALDPEVPMVDGEWRFDLVEYRPYVLQIADPLSQLVAEIDLNCVNECGDENPQMPNPGSTAHALVKFQNWERVVAKDLDDGERGERDGEFPKKTEPKPDPEDIKILAEIASVMREQDLSFRRACLDEVGDDESEYHRLKKWKQRAPKLWASLCGGEK